MKMNSKLFRSIRSLLHNGVGSVGSVGGVESVGRVGTPLLRRWMSMSALHKHLNYLKSVHSVKYSKVPQMAQSKSPHVYGSKYTWRMTVSQVRLYSNYTSKLWKNEKFQKLFARNTPFFYTTQKMGFFRNSNSENPFMSYLRRTSPVLYYIVNSMFLYLLVIYQGIVSSIMANPMKYAQIFGVFIFGSFAVYYILATIFHIVSYFIFYIAIAAAIYYAYRYQRNHLRKYSTIFKLFYF